jgi:hypothetical protein
VVSIFWIKFKNRAGRDWVQPTVVHWNNSGQPFIASGFFHFQVRFYSAAPFCPTAQAGGAPIRWTADPASAKRQKSGGGIKSWKNSCCYLFLITFILRLTCLAWKQNGFIVHIVCRYEFSRRSTGISFPVVRSLRTRPIRSPSGFW